MGRVHDDDDRLAFRYVQPVTGSGGPLGCVAGVLGAVAFAVFLLPPLASVLLGVLGPLLDDPNDDPPSWLAVAALVLVGVPLFIVSSSLLAEAGGYVLRLSNPAWRRIRRRAPLLLRPGAADDYVHLIHLSGESSIEVAEPLENALANAFPGLARTVGRKEAYRRPGWLERLLSRHLFSSVAHHPARMTSLLRTSADWESHVIDRIHESRLILLIPGTSEGIQREIALLAALDRFDSATLIIIPYCLDRRRTSGDALRADSKEVQVQWQLGWEHVRTHMGLRGVSVPTIPSEVRPLVASFNAARRLRVVTLPEDADPGLAMAREYQRLLPPILRADRARATRNRLDAS